MSAGDVEIRNGQRFVYNGARWCPQGWPGEGVKLAIVGSTTYSKRSDHASGARSAINAVMTLLQPTLIISGGAEGVDTFAREAAEEVGIEVLEYLPKNKRWKPDGFEARNRLIAEQCDKLVAIRHPRSATYGSGWTADLAEKMGKQVIRITTDGHGWQVVKHWPFP